MASKWEINKAVRTSGLPAPSRLIILVLSDLADVDTGIVPDSRTPSLRELAEWTGLDKSTVTRHLDALDASGWVVRTRPAVEVARREHVKTTYRIGMPLGALCTMPEGPNETGMVHSATSQTGHVGNSMVHSATAMVQSAPSHGAENNQGMVQSATVPYTDNETTTKDTSTSENDRTSEPKRPRRSKPKQPTDRPDVERLCDHLADRIEANGSTRPNIGKKWRDAARLMLDNDGRTEEQVHKAIDWCQSDEFWRGNILSMPKLRQQYEQLRLRAMRANGRASPGRQLTEVNGLMLGEANIANLERAERIRRLQQTKDAQQLSIEGLRT